MATVCFDSSALVKLLIEEQHTTLVRQLWLHSDLRITSRLAVPEVAAALAAGLRNHRLDRAGHRAATALWASLVDEIRAIELTGDLAEEAADLARRHPLSGADAVHVASALRLKDGQPIVATWDRRLHAAARAEGLAVVPATIP